ncbi:helix-turn-helix domain-containing protein [Roseomonas sp. GC11]|uniref:helix-turn-helix domain-containing protein n=1 Tax=Roseomonas sp. GC11 TaxID=2950546 RepID=UPI002108ACFA|nr:helix-turn-helix domain-containing protein [Roseomonas sp. GC11]MCQ4160822.1 helix-turn-helix domain-containing protein [Roseomonas sp. GC11]
MDEMDEGENSDDGNASRLTEVGRALYGRDWQSPLAADLDVTPRLVRMWIHGDRRIPDRVMSALPDLLSEAVERRRAEAERMEQMARMMRPG